MTKFTRFEVRLEPAIAEDESLFMVLSITGPGLENATTAYEEELRRFIEEALNAGFAEATA